MQRTVEGPIEVRRVDLKAVAALREDYRVAAGCQIVRDSILPRGLGDPFLMTVGGVAAGYAGVWNAHLPGRVFEVGILPAFRGMVARLVGALAVEANATEMEVQSNLHAGRALLEACATEVRVENLLFQDGGPTELDRPDLHFRPRAERDEGPEGDWVIEREGAVIGAGGWLTHYNPPYADLYVEVMPSARRQGVGSFLVQELRRACSKAGFIPAARCDPENEGSARCLEGGGMRRCGEILVGRLQEGLDGMSKTDTWGTG